ncbi:MAG: SUMF1/EgtB/PvdO family nonheme iron enzyme, partial [Myxococcales bacterium]|nr:SUMF1/EgtB/PvdO family nonheme iron enzyme [Myxococcales bacterium]
MRSPSSRVARLPVLGIFALLAWSCDGPTPPMPASPLVIPPEPPATQSAPAPMPPAPVTAPPTEGPPRLPPDARVAEPETPARPALLRIAPGVFLMGSTAGQREHASDERLHRVELSRPFLLTVTEVTQGSWERLMGNNPSFFRACGPRCPVERVNWYEAVTFANTLSASEGRTACYATEGCTGVVGSGCGRATGRRNWCLGDYRCRAVQAVPGCTGYRLPTEAEWE